MLLSKQEIKITQVLYGYQRFSKPAEILIENSLGPMICLLRLVLLDSF